METEWNSSAYIELGHRLNGFLPTVPSYRKCIHSETNEMPTITGMLNIGILHMIVNIALQWAWNFESWITHCELFISSYFLEKKNEKKNNETDLQVQMSGRMINVYAKQSHQESNQVLAYGKKEAATDVWHLIISCSFLRRKSILHKYYGVCSSPGFLNCHFGAKKKHIGIDTVSRLRSMPHNFLFPHLFRSLNLTVRFHKRLHIGNLLQRLP